MSVGFVVDPAPPGPKPCQHRDNWDFKVEAPYFFRLCHTCGASWIFVSLENGVAWEKVAEPEETRDVVGVGQAVFGVPSDEADEPVQRKPRKARRSRQPVSDLPRPVELKPAAAGSEETVERGEKV